MTEMYMPMGADAWELLETYSNAKRGALISAMMRYFFAGEEPTFTGTERHVWPALRRMLDRMRASYAAKREAGNRSAASRTAQKSTEAEQASTDAEQASTDEEQTAADGEQTAADPNTNTNTKTNTKTKTKTNQGSEAKRERFTPPTPEEVSVYCRENGLNVDADRFVDYYGSCGWKVGSAPMKDWQAAVRNWSRKEQQPARPPRQQEAQQYTQREYTASFDPVEDLMREFGRL